MKGVVGVVGLGIMGGAIARNLVSAGWDVVGFDIDEGRRAEAQGGNVSTAASVLDLAQRAPAIITSLPSPATALAVAREIAAAPQPRIVVETSTLSLEDKLDFKRIVEEGGHIGLDCPLSGTGAQAKNKDLVVYASGDSAAIEQLQPVFADFAREAHDVGAFGNGSRMKFVANLLVAINNVASAEAMVLAIKAGLDPEQVVKLVGAGAGSSRIFELRAPMMADSHYEPATMKLAIWQKDMAIIGKFANALGSPTPLFSSSIPIYSAGVALGFGEQDVASVCAVLETMSGVHRD